MKVDIGDMNSIAGLGRSPRGGNGNPLQCSCLENPMDRGDWWATVHWVAKNQTWLKRLSTHTWVIECHSLVLRKILWYDFVREPSRFRPRSLCDYFLAQSLPLSFSAFSFLKDYFCWVIQLCPILCNPMDCHLPGSSVHGIFSGKDVGVGVGCHFLLQKIIFNKEIFLSLISHINSLGIQLQRVTLDLGRPE